MDKIASPLEPQPQPAKVTAEALEPSLREVAGVALHTDGSAISGLVIQAWHRRVGGEISLGVEVATNDRGRYAIAYQPPPGLTKVDLFVRAYDDKNVIATSTIVIGAGMR